VLKCETIQESKKPLIICVLAVCFWAGCSSKSAVPISKTSPVARQRISFIPVKDPVRELCTDDTLSRTEWINVPVVRFSGTAINLLGHTATPKDLQDWAMKYYEDKAERGLWVQIAPGSDGNAEQALVPLVRMLPDLQVRQVEFGFSCPKIHK
jgi:hypothetical protein